MNDLRFWVIVLTALLILAFLWGMVVNRRLGNALYRRYLPLWKQWGRLQSARWLGGATTGLYLRFDPAEAPFRRFEAIFLLEPREFLPVWWVTRWLLGRRDALIFRADLARTPHTEWEWRFPHFRFRAFPVPAPKEGFQPLAAAGFRGWVRPARDEAGPWAAFLQTYAAHLRALSLRKSRPHLILYVHLKGLDMEPFLRDLARVLEAWIA